MKQFAGGLIPWEAALEKLGYTQTEIQRFSAMRLSDALLQGIANPAPPARVQYALHAAQLPRRSAASCSRTSARRSRRACTAASSRRSRRAR
jgi:hypothetical protein